MDKRQLVALCLCLALVTWQGTITVNLLPVYAVQLGANSATTGLFVAVSFFTVTVGNMIGGWLSDRFSLRKRLLLIGCVVWLPFVLLMTQATTIRSLTLLSAISWIPGGIALAMVHIIISLATVESERGKVFGWTALAAGVGGLLAGTVGGSIAQRWGFPVLFVVMAATVVLLLAIATYIQDKSTEPLLRSSPASDVPSTSEQTRIGFRVHLLIITRLLTRLGQLAGGLISPLAMIQLGFNTAEVSSIITVSAAVAIPLPLLLGWLSDKAGRKQVLMVCYAAGVVGLLVMIPATGLWQFWLSACLLAICQGSNGVAQAFVADLLPAQAMGRGMSLLNTTSLLAGMVGVGGAGYLMQFIDIGPTLLFAACLSLIAIGLLVGVHKPVPASNVVETYPA